MTRRLTPAQHDTHANSNTHARPRPRHQWSLSLAPPQPTATGSSVLMEASSPLARPFYGSMGGTVLQRPVVGIVPTKDDGGYWLDASDGGVFSFGDTSFYGSIPGLGLHPAGSGLPNSLNAPIVGMVPSNDDGGYFMVASDGGVFAFGDAKFEGSCPGIGGCSGASRGRNARCQRKRLLVGYQDWQCLCVRRCPQLRRARATDGRRSLQPCVRPMEAATGSSSPTVSSLQLWRCRQLRRGAQAPLVA